jgi:hypothetical protein
MGAYNNRYLANGKGGISFELTTFQTLQADDSNMFVTGHGLGAMAYVDESTFLNNGDLPGNHLPGWTSFGANKHYAIGVNAGQNLEVTENLVDGTKEAAELAGGPAGDGFECQSTVRDARNDQLPTEQTKKTFVDGSRNIHVTDNAFNGDGSHWSVGKNYVYNLNDTAPPDETYTIIPDPHCGIVEPASGDIHTQAGNTN